MDPLSVSASVITLLGAGGTLSKLLRRCIRLKDAPEILRALNDEVSELQCTATDVNDLLWTATLDPDVRPPKSLVSSLNRVKSTLLQLESFVSYQLTTVTADRGSVRLDKSVYLRMEHRIHELKDEIYASRVALALALSLFASSLGIQSRIQSRQISNSLELLHNKFETVRTLPYLVPNTTQQISFRDTTFGTARTESELNERRPKETLGNVYLESRRGIDPDAPSKPQNNKSQKAVSGELHDQMQHKNALIVPSIQSSCKNDCHCPCHSDFQIRSPKSLQPILGSLFLRYRTYPLLKQTCSAKCRARASSITCVYAFPLSLLARAISISYSCALAMGPEFLLRVMQRRDFKPLNILIGRRQSYALEELERMLNCGDASVLDIDTLGYTLLHRVVLKSKWNLAHLLISYGADIHYENPEENRPTSAFTTAWSKRWAQTDRHHDLPNNWDDLFLQDTTRFDYFGFTSLHKAYLGLSGLDFNQTLASTKRSQVDEGDYQGRTVLNWAAARGDSPTVRKLLACSANLEKPGAYNSSPLHFAVSVDVSTTEMLLDAQADVNTTDEWGAIPLHNVTSRTSSLIKRMVDLGADLEKVDAFGRTPLLSACQYGQAYAVKELLACGANINVRSINEPTPILRAVIYNHHQTISVLLSDPNLYFETDDDDDDGRIPKFLFCVAVCSDIRTLTVLKDQWPIRRTGFEKERFDMPTALNRARHRRNFNLSWSKEFMRPRDEDPIAWHIAFSEMIDTIVERSRHAFDSEDEAWEDAKEEQIEDFFS